MHIDLEIQQERLRLALGADPGMERDDIIVAALANEKYCSKVNLLPSGLPSEGAPRVGPTGGSVGVRSGTGEGARALEPGGLVQAWAACLSTTRHARRQHAR